MSPRTAFTIELQEVTSGISFEEASSFYARVNGSAIHLLLFKLHPQFDELNKKLLLAEKVDVFASQLEPNCYYIAGGLIPMV